MKNKTLLIFSSICTYVCFLGLILLLKKPLCIDSTVVERLDSVAVDLTETAYRCSAWVTVPYSDNLLKIQHEISNRTQQVVNVLESLGPFKKKIHIVVREDRPLAFVIKGSQLQIGSTLFQAPGHLERGLIKIWIRENLGSIKIETTLFEEVMADFIYYTVYGKIEIEDPMTRLKTKMGSAKWPQVLKTEESYCDSAWKASEHFESCGKLEANSSEINQRVLMTLSLRPLLSSSFIQSYKELSYLSKVSLVSHLKIFLSERELSSEKAIEMILDEQNPIKQGIANIKKFSDLFVSATVHDLISYRQLYTNLTSHLQQSGVSDSFAEAYFDYLIEMPEYVSTQTELFKSLEEAALQNLDLQFALKDQTQIWILPSRSSLPLSAFDQIKSRQHIYYACPSLTQIPIQQFFNVAEKLMLIKGCDQNVDYHFPALVGSGIKEFIKLNKKLSFVQFHIPSLEMKQNELSHITNFFELVQNRDMNRQEFKTLGWSQIQWSDEYNAYRPKAEVEAIEYFRYE